jgi:hypothetical protein
MYRFETNPLTTSKLIKPCVSMQYSSFLAREQVRRSGNLFIQQLIFEVRTPIDLTGCPFSLYRGGGAWVHLAAQPVDGELELVVHGGRRGPRPVRVLLDGPLQNLAHNGTMGIIY